MLKERDKKLLFYSWSYGILAAALIYACLGCGVMAAPYYSNASGFAAVYDNSASFVTNHTLMHWQVYSSDVNQYCASYPETPTCMDDTRLNPNDLWFGFSDVSSGETDGSDFSNGQSYDNLYLGIGNFTCYTVWDRVTPSGHNYEEHSIFENCYGGNIGAINRDYFVLAVYNWRKDGNMPYGGQDSKYTIIASWEVKPDDYSDAPVINDFTSDASCYNPGEAIVLESNVTGDVTDWLWEIYDSDDISVYTSTDSVETIVDETLGPGLYQVQLTVENDGGSDFLSKEDWLNVTTAGGCLALNNWSPFPTQTTIMPTQAVFPTMTMPPYLLVNMTGINDIIDNDAYGLGNLSRGYRSTADLVFGGVNETLVMTFSILLTPVTLVTSGLAAVFSMFSAAMNSLMVYTTVPLAITAKIINAMPWQIVTLITAGIAVDAILIVLGKL